MSFNENKYHLFLKLNSDSNSEVKDLFETNHFDIEISLNRFHWTPLQIAAYRGNEDLVLYFLQRGANKDHRNISGFTAQMLAESKGFTHISELIQRYNLIEIEVEGSSR